MKKEMLKKSIIMLVTVCIMALCVGCQEDESKSKKKHKENQVEAENTEGTSKEGTSKEETSKEGSNKEENNESTEDANKADTKAGKVDPNELYDKFLNGEEKVTFVEDVPGTWQMLFDYDPEAFDYSKEYTKDEILEAFAKEQMSELGSNIAQECTCYNLDLGNDGIPEICVEFTNFQDIMDWASLSFVIKEYDGKLKCIYSFDCRSRYDYYISYDGVISSSGSGGADYHSASEAYLDAEGKYIPLYEDIYCGPYSISGYMAEPFNDISDSLMALSNEGYDTEVTFVSFDNESPSHDYLVDFSVYDSNAGDFLLDEDPKTLEVKDIFTQAGIEITDYDDIQDIISERLAELGITEEMRSSSPVKR